MAAEPLELIEFLSLAFEAMIEPNRPSSKIRRLSQLMNIDSSRIEDISIDQRFENLSVLRKPEESDGDLSPKLKKVQKPETQSNSQFTSNRSHFTSIDGPPKIYEDIMR